MEYLAIVVGFLTMMVLSLRGIHVIVAAFIAAAFVVVLAGLPVTESLVDVFFTRFGSIAGSLFPMFLFGAILAKLYANAGAATVIADHISNQLFGRAKDQRSKYSLGFLSVIIAAAILCYGGINAAVALIAIYPIALRIFERADIPKKFIMGAICGGAFTFALSGPGSPQPTNVVAMAIGTEPTAGFVAGIIGALVEIAVMVIIFTKMCETAVSKGERFALGPKDVFIDEKQDRPGLIVSFIPFFTLLILFNLVKLNISISILITVLVTIALFFPYLKKEKVHLSLNEGAVAALVPMGAIAAVNGFAAVIQTVPAYQKIIDGLLVADLSPLFLLVLVVSLICMMTGGSTTGTQIALPILSPTLTHMGMTLPQIHRIGVFAATTLDSLPNSGSVIMAVGLADLEMREGYPPVFISTVVATICGTIAVAAVMMLAPMLP